MWDRVYLEERETFSHFYPLHSYFLRLCAMVGAGAFLHCKSFGIDGMVRIVVVLPLTVCGLPTPHINSIPEQVARELGGKRPLL
jgi:hypothetical protein